MEEPEDRKKFCKMPSSGHGSHYFHDLTAAVVVCMGPALGWVCQQPAMAQGEVHWGLGNKEGRGCVYSLPWTWPCQCSDSWKLVKSSLGTSQGIGKLSPALCVDVDHLCVHKVLTTNSFSQMFTAHDWSSTKTAYRDKFNLLPPFIYRQWTCLLHLAVENKCTEFPGCWWCIHQNVWSTQSQVFCVSVYLSFLHSFLVSGRSSPKRRSGQGALYFHAERLANDGFLDRVASLSSTEHPLVHIFLSME